MVDDIDLCYGCGADITKDVQYEAAGEWFCEDCNDKIDEFVQTLRPATSTPQLAGGE